MDSNWFKELFINEAKSALSANDAPDEVQVVDIIEDYLEDNSIKSISAKIENNVLVIE